MPEARDIGALRRLLEETAAAEQVPMKALTVLAPQRDPFRLDIPARHRDGAWLARAARELGVGDRRIHLRGLHYMMSVQEIPKPDGLPYTNTDHDWRWLEDKAAKAARWLGYIAFEQITDERNAAPVMRMFTRAEPWPYLAIDVDIDVPPVEELLPTVGATGFTGAQPFKLVVFGEKSSLEDVLGPIADEHQTDLYLATGEISDTLIYQMAKIGAADGRPMVVACFSDADPAGWQMPISIGRKLQACKALKFPELEFRVFRAALTPSQVREYGLPSTPLKEEEKRADQWRAAWGIEQTEIDALAALQPDLLRQLARNTLAPFFDHDLDRRVEAAYAAWVAEAEQAVIEQFGPEQLYQLRLDAEAKLATIRAEVNALKDAMRIDADGLELPVPVVPAAELNGHQPRVPLVDSDWSFAEQCRRLIDSKAYRDRQR